MRIAIVGTGAEIPPKGWGAVEAIIWEHVTRLPKFGVDVDLINTQDFFSINWMIREQAKKTGEYDFVHFHYDIQWAIAKALSMHYPVAMTSHFPHIFNESMWKTFGWDRILDYFVDPDHENLNFALSDKGVEFYKSHGAREDRLFKLRNGATEKIKFKSIPTKPNKTIYLGKIAHRKNQWRYGHLDSIDFAGNLNIEDPNAKTDILKNYLGEWSRDQVENLLTSYGNLALLSSGELTPLVVREALIAGLGVVVTETSADELDTSLPFITVVKDSDLEDTEKIEQILKENREASIPLRKQIREYGMEHFSWDACVKDYALEIERAINKWN